MLPVSFAVPAAIVLVGGGLLACFAGYRFFRVVLGIAGFVLGALLASSPFGADQTVMMAVAAIAGGIVGALIMIAAYFVGVALIGATIGALGANAGAAAFGTEPHVLVVVVLAIGGAFAALSLQRYVIILATAFGGAQSAVVGAAAMLGDRWASENAVRTVFGVYPLDPIPTTRWDFAAAIALGVIGTLVQLGFTAKGKGRK